MSVVDEINSYLDTNPEDFVARLVLADALDEEQSSLAEGYRILAKFKRRPEYMTHVGYAYWITSLARCSEVQECLWVNWNKLRHEVFQGLKYRTDSSMALVMTRRKAEDTMAEAYNKLNIENKVQLQNGIMYTLKKTLYSEDYKGDLIDVCL